MNFKLKKDKVLFVALPCIAIAMVVWYYHSKIIAHLAAPKQLFELFLQASGIASFSLQLVVINVALFAGAALIDLLALGFKDSALRRLFFLRTASARGDLWCWVLSVISVYDFFVLFFSMGLFYLTNALLLKAGALHLLAMVPWLPIQVIVVFLLSDLKQYLWHRFMHQPALWQLHAYHHSATEFNLITATRGHFLEKGILTLFDGVLFALLGAPVADFLVLVLVKELYSYMLHSDVNWKLGLVGKYILISPNAHRLHHSKEPRYYGKNFGTFFVFWDKLFGTYQGDDAPLEIGVEGTYYTTKGFWKDMYLGYKYFMQSLFNKK